MTTAADRVGLIIHLAHKWNKARPRTWRYMELGDCISEAYIAADAAVKADKPINNAIEWRLTDAIRKQTRNRNRRRDTPTSHQPAHERNADIEQARCDADTVMQSIRDRYGDEAADRFARVRAGLWSRSTVVEGQGVDAAEYRKEQKRIMWSLAQ